MKRLNMATIFFLVILLIVWDYSCKGVYAKEREEVLTDQGDKYFENGEYNMAISAYSEALKINPNFARAYYRRAVAYCEIRSYSKADIDIKKAQDLGYQVPPDFAQSVAFGLVIEDVFKKFKDGPPLEEPEDEK